MKLLDCLICDDIRAELKNKFSIMGVYGDSINFDTVDPSKIVWPVNLRLGVLFRLTLEKTEKWPEDTMTFEVKADLNGSSVATVSGELGLHNNEARIIGFPVVFGALPLSGEGNLKFSLTLSKSGKPIAELHPPFEYQVKVRKVDKL